MFRLKKIESLTDGVIFIAQTLFWMTVTSFIDMISRTAYYATGLDKLVENKIAPRLRERSKNTISIAAEYYCKINEKLEKYKKKKTNTKVNLCKILTAE